MLVVLAGAVGVFHGFVKPGLDERQVDQIKDFIARGAAWQGRYPPDFRLDLLAGDEFQLSEHIGKEIVVLNFFATWCAPCRAEMPELERFRQAQRARPFLIIGIDVRESRATVQEFVSELKVTFPIALDGDGEVAASYQVGSFPTTVLIGVDGRVHLYETGAIFNADVAFSDHLDLQERLLEAGGGVSREEYMAGLSEQPEIGADPPDEGPRLTGRALEIAQKMPCPCGCEQRVQECGCSTADKIKKRLNEMELEGRTDIEVIRELNREFCVGVTG